MNKRLFAFRSNDYWHYLLLGALIAIPSTIPSPWSLFLISWFLLASIRAGLIALRDGAFIGESGSLIWFGSQIALTILAFSRVYQYYGLVDSDGHIVKEWSSAIYFSVVTFTTLGYGDFRPIPEIRMIAALEALVGYLYLGVMLYLVASHLLKKPTD